MKTHQKFFLPLIIFAALASFFSQAIAAFDPDACYERCMTQTDDKETCKYICYGKK